MITANEFCLVRNDLASNVNMEPEQLVFMAELLQKLSMDVDIKVLEYGSGWSTVFFPLWLKSIDHDFNWLAVEHDLEWLNLIATAVKNNYLTNEVSLLFQAVDYDADHFKIVNSCEQLKIYKNGKIGFNKIFNTQPPSTYLINDIADYDVIIIDGAFRRYCYKHTLLNHNPDSTIVIHDSQNMMNVYGFDDNWIESASQDYKITIHKIPNKNDEIVVMQKAKI